jgi:hypothetical protein
MIVLDFKVDEYQLSLSLEGGIVDEDLGYFTTTMFLMPLRMRINGLEIFETSKENPWSPGPIMDLASDLLKTVKELKKNRKATHLIIEGPGEFVFTMIDDEDVYIEFNTGCVTAGYSTTVKYDELLEAFEKYAEKVRTFLKEKVPQMYDHEYWGPWLRGETECDGSKIKPERIVDATENIEDLIFEWYGLDNPLEIYRSVKETRQNSTKAINEVKAMKTFLLKRLNQKDK